MQLRPYQLESIQRLREEFKKGRRVILCAPTGSGKTVSFTALTKAVIDKDPKARVLILTDRIELMFQAGGTLEKLGIHAGLLHAGSKFMPNERVIVGMVETYHNRMKKGWLIPNLRLVIVDEAHKANFRKVIADLPPDMYVVGATATPLAASKKNPLKNTFTGIVSTVDIPDLVEGGYLSKPRYFAMAVAITASVSRSTGDYNEAELYADYDKPELYAGCVRNWKKHAEGKKTLVFCVNMKHTANTCNAFASAGYECKYVTSETDKNERRKILRWFSQTPGAVLVNCGILTTGYDEPTIECILLNRATTSLPLYLQMVGRGSRVTPGKNTFRIIDMGNNIERLDFWDDERNWISIFNNPPKEGKAKPGPKKACPKCEAFMHVRVMACPQCGYEYPPPEQIPQPEIETAEIDRKRKHTAPVAFLIARCRLMKKPDGSPYKMTWVAHMLLKKRNPLPLLTEYYTQLSYPNPQQCAESFLSKNTPEKNENHIPEKLVAETRRNYNTPKLRIEH